MNYRKSIRVALYYEIKLTVCCMTYSFKLTWTDYVFKIVNIIGKKGTLLSCLWSRLRRRPMCFRC